MSEEQPDVEYVRLRTQHNATIHLADPDPFWPEHYAEQAAVIRAAIGDRALLLEHVGSTSVPGLPAKPILDILLGVADPADEASYVPDLEAAGFLLHLRERSWHEHRLLRGSEPSVNLHVFGIGSPEAERLLLFRDWLRSHQDERDLYAQTKRELAEREWAVVQDYADAKTEVVESIIDRARAAVQE